VNSAVSIKGMLLKPLEWHLYLLGILVVTLFYIQLVVTPMFFVGLIGLLGFHFFAYEQAMLVVYCCLGLGFILGLLWAERIRRTLGIITFHAYLLSTPEIDGWRDPSGNRITKR